MERLEIELRKQSVSQAAKNLFSRKLESITGYLSLPLYQTLYHLMVLQSSPDDSEKEEEEEEEHSPENSPLEYSPRNAVI